jgi:hypothetical protein
MTYPTFSSGDVLTATEMNAVGLWLVKTQTIGSAVATVAVTGAFSTDYENYLITVSGGTHSTGSQVFNLQMGATTTGYYYSLTYSAYNTTASAAGGINVAKWDYAGATNASGLAARIDINSPFLSKPTTFSSTVPNHTNYAGTCAGLLNNTTSYTGFTLGLSAGTITGGTIRIYGYRN